MLYRFGDFGLSPERYELTRRRTRVRLEPRVLEVLAYLVANRERVVSKAEPLDRLWGDVVVTEFALTRTIREVRRALGAPAGRAWIRTVYGRGFQFVGPVTIPDPADREHLQEALDAGYRHCEWIVCEPNFEALRREPRAQALLARWCGPEPLGAEARALLEHAHYFRGEYERVAELATDNLAALPADLVYEYFEMSAPPSVLDRAWLVVSLAQLGRFAEAAAYESEAIRLAEPTQHAFTVAMAHSAAGTLHLLKGNWAQARLGGVNK